MIGHRLLILAGATVIVRDAAGRVLLQRRSDNGQWGLPGGALEPGEDPVYRAVYPHLVQP